MDIGAALIFVVAVLLLNELAASAYRWSQRASTPRLTDASET